MKYALALAGGGTRGAFQAGVWQALSELGIEISAVVGTSIGAVNGAVFASGTDFMPLWKNIRARDIVDVPDGCDDLLSVSSVAELARSGFGGRLDTAPFKKTLMKHIDIDKLISSDIDYGLCTFSVTEKKAVELFKNKMPKDKIIDYILASACMPIFKPVIIDGIQYTDGSVCNNLPVDMLIDRGYDTIIAVSVKGVGYVRDTDQCGINIINISYEKPEVGIMDFESGSICRSIESGYLECMRSFGKLSGEHYYIESSSYLAAQGRFGRAVISGTEAAARILKLDASRKYTFGELARSVLSEYKKSIRLSRLTSLIRSSRSTVLREKLDILGTAFDAANTIVYLENHLADIDNCGSYCL